MRPTTVVASSTAFTSAIVAPLYRHAVSSLEHSLSTEENSTALSTRSTTDVTWRIDDCDTIERLILEDAHRSAKIMMEFAVQKHNENVSRPGSSACRVFELYFGNDPTEETVAFVADKLQRLLHSMKHTTYTCRAFQGDCIFFAAAMVVGGAKPDFHAVDGKENARVEICPAYFNRPGQLLAKRPRASAYQIQVLVHEGLHTLRVPEAPLGITDLEYPDAPGPAGLAYGEHNTQQLATYSAEAALVSADNYRQYVAALSATYETGRMPKHEKIDHGQGPEWTSLCQDDLRTFTSAIGAEATTPFSPESPGTSSFNYDSASLRPEFQILSTSASAPLTDPTTLSTAASEAVLIFSPTPSATDSATELELHSETTSNSVDDKSPANEPGREDRLKQAVGLWPGQYDWTTFSAAPAHFAKWWAPYALVAVAGFMTSL